MDYALSKIIILVAVILLAVLTIIHYIVKRFPNMRKFDYYVWNCAAPLVLSFVCVFLMSFASNGNIYKLT